MWDLIFQSCPSPLGDLTGGSADYHHHYHYPEVEFLEFAPIVDLRDEIGERIDALLTRFDMAREEARSVGAEMTNYHTLTTILLRACRINGEQLVQLCTSPDHLNKTVVILAGYKHKMDHMMETTNPGIRYSSRNIKSNILTSDHFRPLPTTCVFVSSHF